MKTDKKSPICHLITGNELSRHKILQLIDLGIWLKIDEQRHQKALENKVLALVFEKPSFRTRLSFTVAMSSLGGQVIESHSNTRKQEWPEDMIRVLQTYCQVMMIRTHHDQIFDRLKAHSKIPIINGLSQDYHPCQILADLMTLKEKFGQLSTLTLSYIGDGNNILNSLLLMGPKVGLTLHYCCPKGHGPSPKVLEQIKRSGQAHKVKAFLDPVEAVKGTHGIYTDVWTSMGNDTQDLKAFNGFKVTESLMAHARPNAVFMHCMPINREEEVQGSVVDAPYSLVFVQAQNRLHIQKAILLSIL